ncbi:MAG: Calx-beta domain-containing protein, partial [Pseudomonadota bacterium]
MSRKNRVFSALVVAFFALIPALVLAVEIDFANRVNIGNQNSARDLQPFDFDGDGDVDVVGIGEDDLNNNIDLFLNDGNDSTFTNVSLSSTSRPRKLELADLNNDGAMDIVYTDFDDGRVYWHENQFASVGSFSNRRTVGTVFRADGLAVGDLDGDGDLDVVATHRNAGDVFWLANQLTETGTTNFTSRQLIDNNLPSASHVFIADLNGDGTLDIAAGGSESGGFLTWFNNSNGLGTAWIETIIEPLANVSCLNVQDFDEDGNPDLIIQENNSPANPGQQISVWLNTVGDGSAFTEKIISNDTGADSVRGCQMTDLDFDGDFDFVGSRDGEWYDNIDGDSFVLRSFDSSGATTHFSHRIFDMDGDGDQDIFTSQFPGNRFNYYENEYCDAGDPDFDMDGIPDACDDQVAVDSVSVTEGDSGTTTLTFTIELQTDLTGTVAYSTRSDTATGGMDFTDTSGSVTFSTGLAGETESVSVDILGDMDIENAETFFLDLDSADFFRLGTGVGTINNDDGTGITIDDVSLEEGNSGTTDFEFTVTLIGDATAAFTVPYATNDSSALDGIDYTGQSAMVSFSGTAGETQTLIVPVIGETDVENDESFFVVLGAPSDGSVVAVDNSGEGTILNDDTVELTIADAAVDEADAGDETLDFVVQLNGDIDFPFSVDFALTEETATADSDYTDSAGTLNFSGNDGETQTISVNVFDDDVLEGPETLTVSLSNPSSVAVVISDPEGTATITDDDQASLAVLDASQNEGDSGTSILAVTVELTGAVQGTFTVPFSTSDGSALAGDD